MITITTETKRITLKLSEEESSRMFDALVSSLLELPKTEPPKIEPPKMQKPEENEAAPPKEKYTGFLHIKCPDCGNTVSFCTKKGVIGVNCNECGCREPFKEPLKQVRAYCECGERSKYLTNRTEEMFDINCINCGTPVAVKYNAKKGIYETIK